MSQNANSNNSQNNNKAKKTKIRPYKMLYGEYKEAKEQIKALKAQLKELELKYEDDIGAKDEEISTLTYENNQLTAENEKLKTKKATRVSTVVDLSGDFEERDYITITRAKKDDLLAQIEKGGVKKRYCHCLVFEDGFVRHKEVKWSSVKRYAGEDGYEKLMKLKNEAKEKRDRCIKRKFTPALINILDKWTSIKNRNNYINDYLTKNSPKEFSQAIKYHYKYVFSMRNRKRKMTKEAYEKLMAERDAYNEGTEFDIVLDTTNIQKQARRKRAKKQKGED